VPFSSENQPLSYERTDSIRVVTYEVEVGKTLTIPVLNPGLSLVKTTDVASVIQTLPDSIVMQGHRIGETLALVWQGAQVLSFRIRVTRTVEEIQNIEKSRRENSRLYRSQKERTFKVYYDSTHHTLREDRVMGRVHETRKIYDHRARIEGMTPYGEIKGSMFYETRKDDTLEKSVSIPRDFWGGLFGTRLPFLNDYDIRTGTQYVQLSRYGFAGDRFNGISLLPSEERLKNPFRNQMNVYFFVGQKRDGSIIDNPPGSQDRTIKGKVMGERLDYHLWKDGRVSLEGSHQWSSPQRALESRQNFDAQFDFKFPHLRLSGEAGLDDENHLAYEFKTTVDADWANAEFRWFNVNNNYRTISGSVGDRGNRGFQLNVDVYPLKPLWDSKDLLLVTDVEWKRNHLSVNPGRPDDFVKRLRTKAELKLPYGVVSDTSVLYHDNVASSAIYTEKEVSQKLSKSISINRLLLRRMQIFITSTIEAFREAENIAGFNSTRYEVGGGMSVSLKGGLYVSSQFLWNRLKEEDLPEPPTQTTNPRQLTITGGWRHSFRKIPLHAHLDVRYVDEGETHNKTHQPFANEDRLELRGGMTWRIRDLFEFFIQTTATYTKSTVGSPTRSELSLLGGLKMLWDTNYFIPQHGIIEGYVFEDRNGNGQRDPEEPGVMGYEVRIEEGPTVETGRDGFYRLSVKEGNVKLVGKGEIPEGYFYTTPNARKMEIYPGEMSHIDFGISPQVQVKGIAFIDINGNGIYEKGDQPVPAIRVVLNSGQTTLTTPRGLYSILRVAPGSNRVRVDLGSIPAGYRTRTAIEKPFEGSAGDVVHFNIMLEAQRVISGYVFVDRNENGKFDPGERGLENMEVSIEGKIYTTSRNGKYLITDFGDGKQKVTLKSRHFPSGMKLVNREHSFKVSKGPYARSNLHFRVVEEHNSDPPAYS